LRNTLRDDHPRGEKRPHGPVGAGEKNGAVRSSHYPHGLKDRCVGNQAALVVKISVRLNMQRKVYSWDGARRCTICDSVIVRSTRRRTKKEWLPRGSLITLLHTAAGRFSPLGPQAHLLINVIISCVRPLLAVASNPSHSCNVACWHEADEPRLPDDVCCRS
jgi:hypothetical protein